MSNSIPIDIPQWIPDYVISAVERAQIHEWANAKNPIPDNKHPVCPQSRWKFSFRDFGILTGVEVYDCVEKNSFQPADPDVNY